MNNIENELHVHLGCYNYSKHKEKPLIEIKYYEVGNIYQLLSKSNSIIAVFKGTMNFSFGKNFDKQAIAGSIFVAPIKSTVMIDAKEDVTLVIFRLDINLSFCDHFSFEALNKAKENKNRMTVLNCNTLIMNFIQHTIAVLEDGLFCGYLLEAKLKVFLYMLRYYYPIEALKDLFFPILSNDFEFSILVRKHYDFQLNIEDLAEKMNYSVSGFEKRFKKVFGAPPRQWITEQKAQEIYHEIRCSTKTFSELCYDFSFSSPAHFSRFCKRIFNATPGSIRAEQYTNDKLKKKKASNRSG